MKQEPNWLYTKTTRSAASKDSVTLENITLSEAGNVTVNLSPLKKVDSNIDSCDVLVSFIVIVKKQRATGYSEDRYKSRTEGDH